MSTKTVCDQCGGDMNVMGFEVERKGRVRRMVDPEGPWDFCSASCLAGWALYQHEAADERGADIS